MKVMTEVIIRFKPESLHSKWHVSCNGELQDMAGSPEDALKVAAQFIISVMEKNQESAEMRIRWVDVPVGFIPPRADAIGLLYEDEAEPLQ